MCVFECAVLYAGMPEITFSIEATVQHSKPICRNLNDYYMYGTHTHVEISVLCTRFCRNKQKKWK